MIRFLVNTAIIIIYIITFSASSIASDLDNNSFHIQWIKIYMVEPESRWNDNKGRPYHFGFLDYAYDTTVTLNDNDTLTRSIIWDASLSGYPDIANDNIMAIAVVCDGNSVLSHANPPSGNEFAGYYVQACAAATTSQLWPNVTDDNYTHTIFAEKGTGTWCYWCTFVADTLYEIYTNSNHPFFYVSMVEDQNTTAYNRLENELNIYGYPTCYFDGGYRVLLTSDSDQIVYESYIQECGAREVPPMQFSIDMTWLGSATVQIDLNLVHGPFSDVNDENNSALPNDFTLHQNYPNPFNPQTEIGFSLARRTDIEISVYNLLGTKIRTLINKNMSAGNHSVTWDGRDETGREVASGIYFYKMKGSDFSRTRKMVLLK